MDGGGDGGETMIMTEVRGLKKGPWTATEDAILTEYVRKHGEGNWNAVQKNSGLLRCGKSCRLRWANHLRPNLKKGAFTPDEEKIIIDLHARLGNKWARMASQLPGRTDNEIKNYWNTRMKRRQRANLPLYPQEIHHHQHHHQGNDHGDNDDDDQFEFDSFQFTNQDHHHHNNNSSNTSSSSSSFSSSSSQPSKRLCFNPPSISTNPGHLNPIPGSMNFQMFSPYNTTLDHNDNSQFGFSLPLSSSSSSNELCNPNHFISENSDTNNYNTKDIDAMSYSSLLMMGDHHHHHEMRRSSSVPLGLELPSIQPPTHSYTSSFINNGLHLEPAVCNSGLLDALLQESQALSRGAILKDDTTTRVASSNLCADQDMRVKMDFENRFIGQLNSSHQSSFGTNPNIYKEPTMVKATLDDDEELLMSLLNNFPSATPLPDWYPTTDVQPQGSYLASQSGFLVENHQANGMVEPSKEPPSSNIDPIASLGQCYWSNMPGIC